MSQKWLLYIQYWISIYSEGSICTHRDHRTENGLLLLNLTCWKNLKEIVIKSVDVVNCMKYIHFMVYASPPLILGGDLEILADLKRGS